MWLILNAQKLASLRWWIHETLRAASDCHACRKNAVLFQSAMMDKCTLRTIKTGILPVSACQMTLHAMLQNQSFAPMDDTKCLIRETQ